LQPAAGDTGKPCGVDYELKTFVAETNDDKCHKRSSVRLAIRKLTYAPERAAPQPTVEAHRDFLMSPAPLHLECTLDREVSRVGSPTHRYHDRLVIALDVLSRRKHQRQRRRDQQLQQDIEKNSHLR
jgi:hypothetical protein